MQYILNINKIRQRLVDRIIISHIKNRNINNLFTINHFKIHSNLFFQNKQEMKSNIPIIEKQQEIIVRDIPSRRIINLNVSTNKNFLSTIKFNFSEYQINKKTLDKKKIQIEKQTKATKTRTYIEKKLMKIFAVTITSFLIFWGINGKELFTKLEVDKKYFKKIKEGQQKNNINLDLNDTLIKEFDQKYGINQPLNDYINKLQYGNKEFNTLEEKEMYDRSLKNKDELIQSEANQLTIDLTSPMRNQFDSDKKGNADSANKDDKNNSIIVEEREIMLNNQEKRNVRKIKADGYEQISVFENNFDNPDPRILRSTIVFDSRLDNKK